MITHFLPRWLLGRFRGDGLYELDTASGNVERRSIEKAGSGGDLWPAEIEKSVLGAPDNNSAQVYRKCIAGKSQIVLDAEERRKFARWLATFVPRVPSTLRDYRRMIQETRDDPQRGVVVLREHRQEVLSLLREAVPVYFDETVAALGTQVGEEKLIAEFVADFVARVPAQDCRYLPEPTEVLHEDLKTAEPYLDAVALQFCSLTWVWLHSNSGFVIGDNPLVCWHVPTGRPDCDIAAPDVEIAFPLAANLCLLMDGPQAGYCGHLLSCDPIQTQQLNHRQYMAATAHVYAGAPSLLRSLG